MKITLDIPNIKIFTDGLNNAIIAYGNIVSAIQFGCEIPQKLQLLQTLEDDVLKDRFDCLKDVYKQLIEIEKGE